MKKTYTIFALILMMTSMLGFVSAQEEQAKTEYSNIEQQGTNCYQVCQWVCPEPPINPKIDVVFAIDTTGSMSDEIRSVKTHIEQLVADVKQGTPTPQIRVGFVAYRDYPLEEPEYITKKFRLTNNIEYAMSFLEELEARGGGDHPEAVADGLHVAINEMNWDDNAKKLIFLIGDAAPHGEGAGDQNYQQGSPNGYDYRAEIQNAQKENIVIYTISGSGMESVGIRIWKEIAAKTGGEYEQLRYVRKEVEEYYAEEGLDMKWAAEATKDSDYDEKSNTILTNTLGIFAKKAVMSEAIDMGVSYEDTGEESTIEYENPITGRVITSAESEGFFRRAINKILFWK
ncbi:MAG: vWA domain-containing protein [Nanoarchaeota archaeon]|nr:VWA domain-containing protein [Nanoarchaeota archaeon]MBU1030342.1 VWA domain-containing protein [Nanoarchaeota archaeon]